MTARVRRDRLEVQHDREPELPVADVAAPPAATRSRTSSRSSTGCGSAGSPRPVRLEAADFLMPSQVQQSSRRRLARVMARMREQARLDP